MSSNDLQPAVQRIVDRIELPVHREPVEAYLKARRATLDEGSLSNRAWVLVPFANGLPCPFEDVDVGNVQAYFDEREDLEESTKKRHRSELRDFFTWLDPGADNPIEKVDLSGGDRGLSQVEGASSVDWGCAEAFLEVSASEREKALTVVRFETGAIPAELAALDRSQVVFVAEYALLTIPYVEEGPSQGSRPVILHRAVPYLRDWLAEHPAEGTREGPLFVSFSNANRRGRLSADGVRHCFTQLAQAAGLDEKPDAKAWQQGRASELEQLGWREDQISRFFHAGWLGCSLPDSSGCPPRRDTVACCPECENTIKVGKVGEVFCPECGAPASPEAFHRLAECRRPVLEELFERSEAGQLADIQELLDRMRPRKPALLVEMDPVPEGVSGADLESGQSSAGL